MRIDGITMINNSDVVNTKIESGTQIERLALTPTEGMMLYQTDNTPNIYMYIGGVWTVYGGGTGGTTVTLDTSSELFSVSQVYTFTITNHNTFSVYNGTSSLGGIVTISNDQVTYTTSATSGNDILTITQNGIDTIFNIIVAGNAVSNSVYWWANQDGEVSQGVTILNTDIYTGTELGHVTKRNSSGIVQWRFKLNHADKVFGITHDGTNIYVVGDAYQAWASFISKMDSITGNLIWTRHLDNTPNLKPIIAYDVTYDGTDIIVVGQGKKGGTNEDHAFVVKYQTDGTEVWQTQFGDNGGASQHVAKNVITIGTDIYVVGYTVGLHGLIFKLNSAGVLQWARTLNGVREFRGITTDGVDLFVNGRRDVSTAVPTWAKYNSAGALQYQRKKDTFDGTWSIDGIAHYNGEVFMVGSTAVNGSSISLIVKTNALTGNIVATYTFTTDSSPVVGNDIFQNISIDEFGNLFIIGTSRTVPGSNARHAITITNGDQGIGMSGITTNPLMLFNNSLQFTDIASSFADNVDPGVLNVGLRQNINNGAAAGITTLGALLVLDQSATY